VTVIRGPGDSKLLCGPTTRIEGNKRCDRQGRGKARKRKAEKARTKSAIIGIQLF